MRYTDEEIAWLKATFGGTDRGLMILRKTFLPEYDPKAPLGQTVDLWMTIKMEGLSPDEKLIRLEARNSLIVHIESQLLQLHSLANMEEETTEAKAVRLAKDSMK